MSSTKQTGNGLGGGAPSTQQQQLPMTTMTQQQGSQYAMSSASMTGLDPANLNTMGSAATTSNAAPQQQQVTTPSLNPLTTSGHVLESLAPKFPPQNFEVPDISFSNSVTPNLDFDPSLFSSVQIQAMTGAAAGAGGPLFSQNVATAASSASSSSSASLSSSSGCMAGAQPMATAMTSSNHMAMSSEQAMMMTTPAAQRPLTSSFLPTGAVSGSPPGTSSSEDSDDLPLAQIAMKRTAGQAVSCSTSGHPATMSATTTMATMATTGVTSTASTRDHSASPPDVGSLAVSPPPGKKAKASKRKKKKDPNEPQKPVSAYALFFRDTQATIKGHNPSASFGEVSKIVASMWDQLDPKHKDVYKKKTEAAKKLYLKQLAAYRASQVSQSAVDESDKSPSPPRMGGTPPGMGGNSAGVVQNPGMIHPVTTTGPGGTIIQPHMPVSVNGPMMHMPPQVMQQQQQQQQQFMHQQQQQLQMQQHHHHHHQQQQHMSGLSPQNMSPSPPASLQPQSQHSPPQQQHQQQQQQHHQQQQQLHLQTQPQPPQVPLGMYSNPPQGSNGSYHQTGMGDHSTAVAFQEQHLHQDMDMAYNRCTRNGCSNQVIENPAWDSEYCSNECVITHCRDVFSSWSAARSGSNNTFPVK